MHISERIRRHLFTRGAGAVAVVVWVAILVGCMSISIGGRHVTTGTHEDGAFLQEGKIHLAPEASQLVYYPIPYSCPPNLEIDSCLHQCQVVEQSSDCFRVANNGVFARNVGWTARGIRAGVPALVGPPPPIPTLPPPQPVTPPE